MTNSAVFSKECYMENIALLFCLMFTHANVLILIEQSWKFNYTAWLLCTWCPLFKLWQMPEDTLLLWVYSITGYYKEAMAPLSHWYKYIGTSSYIKQCFTLPTFELHNHIMFIYPVFETSQNQQDELWSDTGVVSEALFLFTRWGRSTINKSSII